MNICTTNKGDHTMFGRRLLVFVMLVGFVSATAVLSGCVNVKAPKEIHVGHSKPKRVDTSRVPKTHGESDCRQKLAEAYERLDYLEGKVDDLEDDKRELKREKEEYKKKYKRLKDRYDD